MDSQLFFFINMGLAVFFLLWFWQGRRSSGRTPTKLNLRNQETSLKAPPRSGPRSPEAGPAASQNRNRADLGSDEMAVQKAKNLNILFIYNGHDWDAYQVLGLPAGASLPLVTERFQQLVKQADAGQILFYEAAYEAILKKF